jgi:hypothetical protein
MTQSTKTEPKAQKPAHQYQLMITNYDTIILREALRAEGIYDFEVKPVRYTYKVFTYIKE